MGKLTTMLVDSDDVRIAHRIKGELDCKTLRELFHTLLLHYVVISGGVSKNE